MSAVRTTWTGATLALLGREWRRVVRQPSRVIATIGTVGLLWLVLGSGLAGMRGGGEGFSAFLLPGMASMVVVFASIFGAISLIEDRQEGFLQGVLVSAAPRSAIAAGKLLAAAALACVQAGLLLAAGPMLGLRAGVGGYALALVALLAISLGVTGIALALAWKVNSVAGFHGVMNLVLMPMWLLSGAVFPPEQAAAWMQHVMAVNPLSWPTRAMHGSLGLGAAPDAWSWIGSAGFALAGIASVGAVLGRVGGTKRGSA